MVEAINLLFIIGVTAFIVSMNLCVVIGALQVRLRH